MGRGAGHPAREFAPCGRRFDVSGGLPFLTVCATYRWQMADPEMLLNNIGVSSHV
jgi:hypothetical protein